IDREVKREVAVGVPHEVEAGPPLVQLPLQSDHLRLELGVGNVVLGRPGQRPEWGGREAGTESEILLARRTRQARNRPGAGQGVVKVGRELAASTTEGYPPAVVERAIASAGIDHIR